MPNSCNVNKLLQGSVWIVNQMFRKGHHKIHSYWIKICTKATRQQFPFLHEACPIPSSELFSMFQSNHDSSATVLQIPIGRASTRRYNIALMVFPHISFHIHNMNASNWLMHMMISRKGNVFVNDEHVFTEFLDKCTLMHQRNLMKWHKVRIPRSVHSLT